MQYTFNWNTVEALCLFLSCRCVHDCWGLGQRSPGCRSDWNKKASWDLWTLAVLMHQNKISLKYLTAVALQHLNAMTWPVVTERETLFLSSLQVSVLSVRHPHSVHHRSPALNWVDLHRMKCFTCKNNNNPICSVVRFSCQKKNRIQTHIFCKAYWDTAGGGEPWNFKIVLLA